MIAFIQSIHIFSFLFNYPEDTKTYSLKVAVPKFYLFFQRNTTYNLSKILEESFLLDFHTKEKPI